MSEKVSLLLPTLGHRQSELRKCLLSLMDQSFLNFEIIVISQSNHKIVSEIISEFPSAFFKHIEIERKGISIARNEGLKYVTGSVLAFSDDDCWYHQDALQIVIDEIKESKAEIVTFKHYDLELKSYHKKYSTKKKNKLSKLELLKLASLDIYVNLNEVKLASVSFDERFGVGSTYSSGEENIMLFDLYKSGTKKITYVPKVISYHPFKKHAYLKGDSYIQKAALFKRLFGDFSGFFWFFLFSIKKRKGIDDFYRSFIRALREYYRFRV